MTAATTMSKIVSTISVGVSVVYVVPWTSCLTSTSFTTSPARAGAIALTPTPAKYAPVTWPSGTLASGYAAAMIDRHATARAKSRAT